MVIKADSQSFDATNMYNEIKWHKVAHIVQTSTNFAWYENILETAINFEIPEDCELNLNKKYAEVLAMSLNLHMESGLDVNDIECMYKGSVRCYIQSMRDIEEE